MLAIDYSSACSIWPRPLNLETYSAMTPCSIHDLKSRAILRLGLAVIVNPRSRNIRMSQPLLHLVDVGLVVERIGRSGCTKGVRADLEPERGRVTPHHFVDRIRRDGSVPGLASVVVDRAKKGSSLTFRGS